MAFCVVYIKEAHPSDGWRMPQNDRSGIDVNQPKTETERIQVAQTACKALKLSMPCLIDDMLNSTDQAWSGWPDRLFVVAHDGLVAYRGEPGPRGFDAKAWEVAIKIAIEKAPAPKPDADKPDPDNKDEKADAETDEADGEKKADDGAGEGAKKG